MSREIRVVITADWSALELAMARMELALTYARLRARRARWAWLDAMEAMR